MGVNELKKWNYAHLLHKPCTEYDWITILKSLPRAETIHMKIHHSDLTIPPRAIILDFEGNPVFMVGIMINNTLLSFYIKGNEHKDEFYCFILQMLTSLKGAVYFTFSPHEEQEIKKMYQYLTYQGRTLSCYCTLEAIPIINMQLSKFESVLEALYSCHPQMKITGDALFRNTRLVDQLFYAKKYNEVINHNYNCLENESIILNKRWLKLYTI